MKKELDIQKVFDCSGKDYSVNLFHGASDVTKAEWVLIRKYLDKKGKILDLCCGPGTKLIPLVRDGYNVSGIDFSKYLIEQAKRFAKKENLKIKIKHGDATKLKEKDGAYDFVIIFGDSIGLIPLVWKRQKAIDEVYRILKKSGIAIITFGSQSNSVSRKIRTCLSYIKNVLNGSKARYNLSLGDCLYDINGNIGVHHSYSKKEAIHSLKKSGFRIIELIKAMNKMIFVVRK